ncbi:hypothetical protein [Brevibacillus choshinensis]|uniref:Uncharacterized protein n=1 Tax=Brevibacillus choshinensis TaxID=54911 RepID=A0ABX7FI90_BRECH|nr:hypothetical protein [Brevibacillus choshinensis]QRG65929.1 hypothetical protein JNE38_20440 [Brevibacillus choshinensis]
MSTLTKALLLAAQEHDGQTDIGGAEASSDKKSPSKKRGDFPLMAVPLPF